MQALYAFFQSDTNDLNKAERTFFSELEKMYDYYLYLLLLFEELAACASNNATDEQQKYFPSLQHVTSSNLIAELKTIQYLGNNSTFKLHVKNRKISWTSDNDVVQKIYLEIKKSKEYEAFVSKDTHTTQEDNDFLIQIFKKYVAESYHVQHFLTEKNIHWIDDSDLVNSMVIRTIKSINETTKEKFTLSALYKDEEDDRQFARELLCKTILNNEEFEKIIAEKTKNWDVERIAMLDIILMKMAISEILYLPFIPVKVSINEYIDISKEYSTPKSKVFINGIVDKLVLDLKAEGRVVKKGRGLIE